MMSRSREDDRDFWRLMILVIVVFSAIFLMAAFHVPERDCTETKAVAP